ncbi:cation diffusion facilitator family transporter [Bdellovibrionota bacterium FG-2]
MKQPQCQECAVKAAWIGVGISFVLALMKYYIGWVGGSAGVMAAAIHSTVCLVSSASILFTQYFAGRKPDERYPYGYGKIEFVASALVNTSILVVMSLFLVSNVRALLEELHHVPHVTAAVVAATSVIANEFLFRYFRCVGSEMNSPTIMSAAWAVRTDALTSLVVLLAIIGTSLGIQHLDPVVAICIILILFKIVGENLIRAVQGLMDYSMDDGLPLRIKILLKQIPEIIDIPSLKTRSMGQVCKVDLELKVAPELTAEETGELEQKVCRLIRAKEQRIGDITVGFVGV